MAHHLVVDGVSWRILVPDLVSAWAQLDTAATATLAPVGTSMRRWAHALTDATATRTSELDHWRNTLSGPDPLLGARALDPTLDTVATSGRVTVELPVDATTRLLTVLPSAFRADAIDALLAALAIAVRRWRRARGTDEPTLLLQLEGHGREETLVPGADLTRTVGWFTSVYPARFDLTTIPDHDTDTALKTVKEQRRAIPDNGIGYGLLQDELADVRRTADQPQLPRPWSRDPPNSPNWAGRPPPTSATSRPNPTRRCRSPPPSTSTPASWKPPTGHALPQH